MNDSLSKIESDNNNNNIYNKNKNKLGKKLKLKLKFIIKYKSFIILDFFRFLSIFYFIIILPIKIITYPTNNIFLFISETFFDSIFIIDFLFCFFIGFYSKFKLEEKEKEEEYNYN
jgi:hypothetical protein